MQGGSSENGVDCYGLVKLIYTKYFNKNLPIFASPDDDCLVHQLIDEGKQLFIQLTMPKPFCLVTFATGPYVDHIGMVLEDIRYFIHAMKKRQRVTVERLDHRFWAPTVRGFYEWTE